MADAQEKKPLTAFDLVRNLSDYIDDNANSRNVESRWLAAWLKEQVLPIAVQLKRANLEPEQRKLVSAFRQSEIQKERAAKQREIDVLDRESSALARAEATPN